MQLQTAETLKDNGQQLALWKAGPDWTSQAIHMLRVYATQLIASGEPTFTFEQFRIYALECGLPEPASINAWGALTKSAQHAQICRPTDRYIKATRPQSHARVIRVWRAC